MESGVGRVGPVIPHDPDLAGRDDDVEGTPAACRVVAGLEVGLGDGDAVHGELPTHGAADDMVARQPDDALDEVFVRVVGGQPEEDQRRLHRGAVNLGDLAEPMARVGEDDDVPPTQLERPGRQLADQDPIVLDEGVLHRPGGDVEGLHQEGLDDKRERHREGHHDDDLANTHPDTAPEAALHQVGAWCGGRRFVGHEGAAPVGSGRLCSVGAGVRLPSRSSGQ